MIVMIANESQQMFFTEPFEEHYIICIFKTWFDSIELFTNYSSPVIRLLLVELVLRDNYSN
jgi:hypothetical protein